MIAVTGLVLEGLVAVLLVVTIIYCILLDRRIRSFKAEQINLAGLVAQLSNATEHAEVAVAGLKSTAEEADGELDGKLRKARSLSEELAFMVETGNNLAGKLADPARRGPLAGQDPAADNVAYLTTAARSRSRTIKTEPAFANPVARSAAASSMPGQHTEPGAMQARCPVDPNRGAGLAAKVRPQRMPMGSQADLPADQLPGRAVSSARPELRAAASGAEARQSLAQALRYAR